MFEGLLIFYKPWFFFLWGACWGSFLNVVVFRYPLGQSIVAPPSSCPTCHKPIAAYDNIPVLSWFLLMGQCRRCKSPFSFKYVLNEILAGTTMAVAVIFYPRQWALGLSLGTALLAGFPMVYLRLRYGRAPWYLVVVSLACGAFYFYQVALV